MSGAWAEVAIGAEVGERGEGSRLGRIYRDHADHVARLAYLLTGDPHLAEDLTQEAFVRLARRLVHVRDPDAVGAYLRRIVLNLVASHHRRLRVERAYVRHESAQPEEPTTTVDVPAREEMRAALLRLTPRQRAAIVLRFYEDLSEQQTADLMRCRPGTVKSLVSQGMERLRAEFGGE